MYYDLSFDVFGANLSAELEWRSTFVKFFYLFLFDVYRYSISSNQRMHNQVNNTFQIEKFVLLFLRIWFSSKMTKRVLRPRKEIQMVTFHPEVPMASSFQPAKRTRRAISTIERIVHQIQSVYSVSTQTDDCLLSATNAKLVDELIEKNRTIEKKDQQYIQILERFYLEKEKMAAEIREKRDKIARLTEAIQAIQAEPLVQLVNNGRSNYAKWYVEYMN